MYTPFKRDRFVYIHFFSRTRMRYKARYITKMLASSGLKHIAAPLLQSTSDCAGDSQGIPRGPEARGESHRLLQHYKSRRVLSWGPEQ